VASARVIHAVTAQPSVPVGRGARPVPGTLRLGWHPAPGLSGRGRLPPGL